MRPAPPTFPPPPTFRNAVQSEPHLAAAVPTRQLRGWRNAVFAVFLVSGLSLGSWVSRIPAVRDDLVLGTAEVGVLIFGLSAGSVLGLVVAAAMLATLGARRAMLVSISVGAAGLILIGAGTSVFASDPLAFAGLALLGFGMGSVDVMMNVEGAAAEQQIGKTLMPLMHACFSLGSVLGALLGAAASAVPISVGWHLAAIAVLVLATTIVAVRFIPTREDLGDQLPGPSQAPRGAWRIRLRESLSVWRDANVLLIGVIVLGMSFAEGSANDWLALAAVDGHGLDNTGGAVVFGIFVASMTVGRVAGGPLLDRFGRVPVLRACSALGAGGLLLFILAPSPWLAAMGTVMWGLGASLGFPVGMSAAADDPKRAAARVSVVAVIGYCAFLVGPPLLGLLGDAFGILNALFVILALMVIAGLASPAARERSRGIRPAAGVARPGRSGSDGDMTPAG